jgi:STE24 endopeptidase
MSSLDFSHQEVLRARTYHRPLYLALVADTALYAAVLVVLGWVWSGPYHLVSGLDWAGAAAGYAAIVVTVSSLVRLPLGYWRGFVRERRWGFSTQTARAWLVDRTKGWGVSVVLVAAGWTAVVGLARAFPSGWPVVAGAVLAGAVLVLSFLMPLVFEPLFNRFEPLEDEQLAGELRNLAERARVPVRDILVADASRRTTKVNAYVSGLGRTRRVVLYDTLLQSAGEREVKLILAHELGHRRERHVAKGTLLAMASVVIRTRSEQRDVAALGARRRLVLARPDARRRRVRAHPRRPRPEEPRRPRAAAARVHPDLQPSDAAGAARARARMGRRRGSVSFG